MLSHIILGQTIFTLLIHIFITLPCVIILLKNYVDSNYSLVLRVYLYYLIIFSSASVIYCIYLLIFWSPEGNGYNLQILSLLGSISWGLQFACYNIEFFICFERCLTIILKLKYTNRQKNFIGVFAIVTAFVYLITIFLVDKLPFLQPNLPTKCQFYGCILDQKPIVFARFLTIANSILNIFCAFLLIVLIRIFLKNQNNGEMHLYKSILLTIISTTIFQFLSNVIPTLTYMIFSTPLTSFLGPIWYTIMSINVAFSAFIYFQAFKTKTNVKRHLFCSATEQINHQNTTIRVNYKLKNMEDCLPLSYRKKLDLLRLKVNNVNLLSHEKKEEFEAFSKNYLLLPELWIQRLKTEFASQKKTYNKIINQALFEFYSEKVYDSIEKCYIGIREFHKIPFDRLMTDRSFKIFKKRCEILKSKKECENFVKDFLKFPHSKLKETLEIYKEYTGKFITSEVNQIYEKSRLQYEKIISDLDNIEKWFTFVIESGDMRFIIQNIEVRIAEEYSNKKLWTLYISFLKNTNKMAAYEVYYRYSRLFFGDKKFKDDFKYMKTHKSTYSGTKFLQNHKFGTSFIKKYKDKEPSISLQSSLHLKTKRLPHQSFKFPVKMIEAIIKNANSTLIRKLYFCSKYFFIKFKKLPLCHTFVLGNDACFYHDSLQLNEAHLNVVKKIGKLIVEEVFAVEICASSYPTSRTLLSTVVSHFQCENIRVLKIQRQDISLAEYNYLTENGSIEKIVLSQVHIKDENDQLVDLFSIFITLPNAAHIVLNCFFAVTAGIWNSLKLLKRNVLIKHLYLSENFIANNDDYFLNFLLASCAHNATIIVKMFNYNDAIKIMKRVRELAIERNVLFDVPEINLLSHTTYFNSNIPFFY